MIRERITIAHSENKEINERDKFKHLFKAKQEYDNHPLLYDQFHTLAYLPKSDMKEYYPYPDSARISIATEYEIKEDSVILKSDTAKTTTSKLLIRSYTDFKGFQGRTLKSRIQEGIRRKSIFIVETDKGNPLYAKTDNGYFFIAPRSIK
jgi:hypothetical protein